MRVIAGEYKGRRLKAVPGKTTRPTTDKVKESIFQVMGPFFGGGTCLDLFAGSGSLGIEALSRGMTHITFVEKNPKALQTIKFNVETLHMMGKTDIFRSDAFRALKALSKRNVKFNLILLDPPYDKVDYENLLSKISELNLVKNDGLVYCEYDSEKELPTKIDNLFSIKHMKYGKTSGVSVYRKGNEHE